ncbi:MAG: PD40 domain-containing protein [Acidobacteria bacterium]|nr:PD40 domain-containing protein [Acidobacteriota bacterium]
MKTIKSISVLIILSILVSPVMFSQTFGKNKVNYDDFDWMVYKTPHFDIFYYSSEEHLLNTFTQWLESSYIYLSKKYDWVLSKRIPVFFYKTKSEFEQTTLYPAFLPWNIEAFAEGLRNRFVIPLDQPPAAMQQLIVHEMTHIFQYDIFYNLSYAKRILATPPMWLMEGMAEHSARGYTTEDEMRVRDIVLHDAVPDIRQLGSSQFIAYQLGQTIIDYMVDRYNQEGFNSLLQYLRRNGAGGENVLKGIEDVFKITPYEFSNEWRKWLRSKYMEMLVTKKEASDYGDSISQSIRLRIFGLSLSPSGELITAFTSDGLDLDIALLSAKDGHMIKNLTSGLNEEYDYLIGGEITHRFHGGKDIAWSPDGNTVAVFARTGQKRSLFLLDVYTGVIKGKFSLELDQALNPEFTIDGKSVLFSAIKAGTSRDIYKLDIASGKVEQLTKDNYFNFAPTASKDGKYVYFFSNLNGYRKLFRFPMDDPSKREQITFGNWNDLFPSISPDGKRLLYISDETGIYNVYEIDLENRERKQYTDVFSGIFNPQYTLNSETILFMNYNKMGYQFYRMTLNNPIIVKKIDPVKDAQEQNTIRADADSWKEWNTGSTYLPPIEVSKDKLVKEPSYDFFVDDLNINAGMSSDGTLLTLSYLQFSDITSAIKFRLNFATIGSYRNVGLVYLNQQERLNWGFTLFDYTRYFNSNLNFSQNVSSELQTLTVENMGATLFGYYPFSTETRLEVSLGYENRDYSYTNELREQLGSVENYNQFYQRFKSGNFAPISVSLVHDSIQYYNYEPLTGTRFRLSATHSVKIGDAIDSYTDFNIDYRTYLMISRDIVLAVRLVGNHSFGDSPNIYFFGGTDTVRGLDYLEVNGNTTFYGNFELRFPITKMVELPFGIYLRTIRGLVFFDVGGAFYEGDDFKFFTDNDLILEDAVAAYGFGFNFNFGGLELHFEWARQTDLSVADDWEFQFWIGYKF